MGRNRMQAIALSLLLLSAAGLQAANKKHTDSTTVQDPQAAEKTKEMAARIFYSEAKFVQDFKAYSPMAETYIQNFKGDRELGQVPTGDKYFIGRLMLKNGIENLSYQNNPKSPSKFILEKLNNFYKMNYVALGFMQLVYIPGFVKKYYDL